MLVVLAEARERVRLCVYFSVCQRQSQRPFFLTFVNTHPFTSLNEANALLYKRDELIGNITRADDELGAKEDALKVRDRHTQY